MSYALVHPWKEPGLAGKRHKDFLSRKLDISGLPYHSKALVRRAYWFDCRFNRRWTSPEHRFICVLQLKRSMEPSIASGITPTQAIYRAAVRATSTDEYIQGVQYHSDTTRLDIGGRLLSTLFGNPPKDHLFKFINLRSHFGSLTIDSERPIQKTEYPVNELCVSADKEFRSIVPLRINEGLDKWSHSLEKTDLEAKAMDGATIYVNDNRRDFCVPAWLIRMTLIFISVNMTPRGKAMAPRYMALPDPTQAQKRPNTAATGYVPGTNAPMVKSKEFSYFHVLGVLKHLYKVVGDGVMEYMPWIPVRTAFKSEVVKKEKKIRTIQVVSYLWHVVGKNCVEPFFSMLRTPVNFSGIGLRTRGGILCRVHQFFISTLARIHGLDYAGAKELLDSKQKSEMDKKAWEANTDHVTGRMVQCHWMAGVKSSEGASVLPEDLARIMASFWADFINPLIPICGNNFFTRLGITPSGHILTLDGNTCRHVYPVIMCYLFVKKHGLKFGEAGCVCGVCSHIPSGLIGFQVSPQQLKEIFVFITMGDDYYGIEHALTPHLCWFFDALCGQDTVADVKSDGDAEFLRSRLVKDQHYRDTERVLAKLIHGERDICVRKAACVSLAYEAGSNKELYALLKMYDGIVVKHLKALPSNVAEKGVNDCWEEVAVRTNVLYQGIHYFPSFREVQEFHTLDAKELNFIQKKIRYEQAYRSRYEEVA